MPKQTPPPQPAPVKAKIPAAKKPRPSAATAPLSASSFGAWLAPIIILAGLFRFYNLDAIALWHNEAVTAAFARLPWSEMLGGLKAESLPPLFYILQKIWNAVFGSGTLPLRLLSGLFGLMAVYAGFIFVRAAFYSTDEETIRKNERFAMRAAIFLALSPLLIQYSQNAQSQSLGVVLAFLSSYLLIKSLRSGKLADSIYYSLSVAAGLYTGYYLLPTLLAQGLYLLYLSLRGSVPPGLNPAKSFASLALGAILALPQLLKLPGVLAHYTFQVPGFWPGAETIWKTMFGGVGTNRILVSLGLLVAAAALFYFIKAIKSETKWLVVAGWILPLVFGLFFIDPTELDLPGSLGIVSGLFAVILAGAISSAPSYSTRRILLAGFAAFTIFIFFKNWHDLEVKNLFFGRHDNQKPGTKAAMQFVNDTARPEDKIFAGSPYLIFTVEHYNQTGITPLLYAPSPLPRFLGQSLAQDQLAPDFSAANPNDTAWVVWSRGFGGTKPIVPGNWEIITEKYYADAPGFKGLIVVSEYHVD